MSTDIHIITVKHHETNIRLDKLISEKCKISRNKAQYLIANNKVFLNNTAITHNDYITKINDQFLVHLLEKNQPYQLLPYNVDLNIIHEDEDIIIIDKPPNMVVHPGIGTNNNTLVNALIHYYQNNAMFTNAQSIRPGIVHRLDKDTSGLMIIAKNDNTHNLLSNLFAQNKVKKYYIAVVWGIPTLKSGIINLNLAPKKYNKELMTVVKNGGKSAITEYKVITELNNASVIKCNLKTGRTHQLRVHLSHIGHSIIGDQKYGKNSTKISKYTKNCPFISQFSRQALHSYKLEFHHPISEKYLQFTSNLPDDIQTLINHLK